MALLTTRCLLLCPPRSGSVYMEHFLSVRSIPFLKVGPNTQSTRHATWPPIKEVLTDLDRVIVPQRERRSWYESVWRFQLHHQWAHWEGDVWHPWRPIEHIQSDDFATWITQVLTEHPHFYDTHMRDYGYEDPVVEKWPMEELADRLAELFGVTPLYDRINTHPHTEVAWPDGLAE